MRKSAIISPCGKYRYCLTRRWGDGPLLPFVMLNPSTADADRDDPTIRRCMGFADRENVNGIVVVNLFAYRSTDPDMLRECVDAFGPENRAALSAVAIDARVNNQPVICAWGSHRAAHDAFRSAIGLFTAVGVRLVALGVTKDGHPRHPLYVPADQAFVGFPVA